MRIPLVTDIPYYLIAGSVEHGVDGDGKLDNAKAGSDVSSGSGANLDESLAN